MARAEDTEKVQQLRAVVSELLVLRHKVGLSAAALADLQASYVPSLEPANFQDRLAEDAIASTANAYNVRADPDYQAFNAALAEEGFREAGEEAEGDDDITVTQPQLAPNAKCPISGKPLLEIMEPVLDSKGYVYERSLLEQFLRSNGGTIRCPAAGTNHSVTLSDLKQAKRVIKEQQRAALRRQTQADDTHGNAIEV